MWIEEYKGCGCSSEAKNKKDLLGYCKDHGNNVARYSVPEYHRAKIMKCSNKDFWYVDRIGKIILVKTVEKTSACVEAKNGALVLKADLEEWL